MNEIDLLEAFSKLNEKATKFKKYILILKVLFSTILIAYIISLLDFNMLLITFKRIKFNYFILTITITFVVSLVYNLRYYYILKNTQIIISFINLYFLNRFSNLINFILPGGLGQETGRLIYLKRKKIAVVSSIYDRIIGLLSILLIFTAANILKIPFIYEMLIILVTVILWLIVHFLSSKFKFKFFIPFIISTFYTFGLIIIAYLQFITISIEIDFVSLLFYVPLINILLMLPISINGYGLREYVWFSFLGIPIEHIIVYSFIGYLINLILSLPGFVIIFKKIKT